MDLTWAAGRAGEGSGRVGVKGSEVQRRGSGRLPPSRAPRRRRALRRCRRGAGAAVAAGLLPGGCRLPPPDRGRSLRPGDPALRQDPQPLHGPLRRAGECRGSSAATDRAPAALGAAAGGAGRDRVGWGVLSVSL